MWSFWIPYLGPVLLRRRFKRPKYYRHFVQLVRLLSLCMQFEITDEEIETLRTGFIAWVEEYERIYFQYDVSRTTLYSTSLLGSSSVGPCGAP
ncbi:hypothetical protein B0H14DRAFT_2697280, partial [Mycena olivaceomarginata]